MLEFSYYCLIVSSYIPFPILATRAAPHIQKYIFITKISSPRRIYTLNTVIFTKEEGHSWPGYSYILFFFLSGANFVTILKEVPKTYIWSQNCFCCPWAHFRGPKTIAFSSFLWDDLRHKKLSYSIHYFCTH